MHRNAKLALSVLAATSMVALAGCTAAGGSTDGDSQSLKIVYQKTDSFTALDELFTKIKPEFEAANPGVTVELEPIQANDYSTKLALSQKSAETAPDVFYEDTFRLRSDIDAGYLLNIDDQLADWDEWG